MRRTSTEPQHLARDGVGLAYLVTPVASPHRDNWEFGQDDGPMDGSSYFLWALSTQTNMSIVVPNGDKCLKPGTLASACLLVHRCNLQNFVLAGCSQEKVNDLRFPGREKREISSRDLIFILLTRQPSLVMGIHTLCLNLPTCLQKITPTQRNLIAEESE